MWVLFWCVMVFVVMVVFCKPSLFWVVSLYDVLIFRGCGVYGGVFMVVGVVALGIWLLVCFCVWCRHWVGCVVFWGFGLVFWAIVLCCELRFFLVLLLFVGEGMGCRGIDL